MPRLKHNDQLTRLELQIMQVLWEDGPASVSEAQERLGGKLAYTTVQTMLNVLVRKGKASRTLVDRAYRYPAFITREKALGATLRDVVQRIFGGSAEALVMSLVQKQLTPETLRRLHKLGSRRKRMDRVAEGVVTFVINAASQSVIIALIGIGAARLLRRAPARLRFMLVALTLIAAVAAPVMTLVPRHEARTTRVVSILTRPAIPSPSNTSRHPIRPSLNLPVALFAACSRTSIAPAIAGPALDGNWTLVAAQSDFRMMVPHSYDTYTRRTQAAFRCSSIASPVDAPRITRGASSPTESGARSTACRKRMAARSGTTAGSRSV